MRRLSMAVVTVGVLLAAAPALSQTHAGASVPAVVSSFPTPAPALQGVRLQPITVVSMPDFAARGSRMTRQARKGLFPMSGQVGEQTALVGTPQEVYAQTTLLYRQRSLDSRRMAADRSLRSVQLRSANRN